MVLLAEREAFVSPSRAWPGSTSILSSLRAVLPNQSKGGDHPRGIPVDFGDATLHIVNTGELILVSHYMRVCLESLAE